MAGKHAAGTDVPFTGSLDEIKRTLRRFGADADGFGYAEQGRQVAIQFELGGSRYVMRLTLPDREGFARNRYGHRRPDSAIDKDVDLEVRRLWRSLANGIKATLAMVEDGIVSAEQAFSPYLMLPGGESLWERHGAAFRAAAATGELPALIPGPSGVIALPEYVP